jgi:hypothetical protein
MSIAPSSPPPPRAAALMWLITDVVDAGFERTDLPPRDAGADDDDRRKDHGDDPEGATWHQPRLLVSCPQIG